jgi:hypothetical protein
MAWGKIEGPFLKAMELFDASVAAGLTTQGDRQNGKGDFLNDIIALLLENCAGIELLSRKRIPGLIVGNHNLDGTFPASGMAEFLLEAKAVGIPKHPGNPAQENPLGRGGSADIPKRVKEAAFKTIDLKLEYGRRMAEAGLAPSSVPGGSLKSWLRANKPTTYLFISARVVGDGDLGAVLKEVAVADQVMDGVGLFAFRPTTSATTYEPAPVPNHHDMSKVLFQACQELVGIRERIAKQGPEEPSAPPSPAARKGSTT